MIVDDTIQLAATGPIKSPARMMLIVGRNQGNIHLVIALKRNLAQEFGVLLISTLEDRFRLIAI